jgi:arginine/lysine/ornithine decarboxylase
MPRAFRASQLKWLEARILSIGAPTVITPYPPVFPILASGPVVRGKKLDTMQKIAIKALARRARATLGK